MRRSLFLAFADKSVGTLLSVGMMVIVSRLLTPAEVGLFLVASAAVILIETFRDFGVAACIVQERNLTPVIVRSAATIVTLLSAVFGVVVFTGAGWVAGFYGSPEIATLLQVAALGFLFAPISGVRLALLRRDMAFGAVAVIGISANLAGVLTAIALAAAGWGAVSLSWGSVATAAVAAIGALIARPAPEAFRPALAAWRQIVPFGFWSTLVTLLGILNESMPRLLLGRLLGFGAVGVFSRAVSLTQLPDKVLLGAAQPVVLSTFAARLREGGDLRQPCVTAFTIIASFQWPALACLAILADPIVAIMLGAQWTAVVPLLQVTAVAGMALFPATLIFPLLVSMGRIRDFALLNAVLVPLSMSALAVASTFGLSAVAWALVPVNVVQGAAMLWLAKRHAGFEIRALGAGLARAGAVTVAAAAVPMAVVLAAGRDPGMALTGLALGGAAGAWCACLFVVGNPLASEIAALAGRLVSRLPLRQRAGA
ncbi:oligosaccharide flippase family protein [Roseivivax isoporae]|uniref:Polysaccharide biosynthesis protein n=1 Tax=Roseivivax isoporae LMG 25204 TaxID=1449351 RepID=X7F7F6_9RHOB|nr:oligosaccharide flippase family protein [Roseivivax isoporae]ETX28745.1 hypothetical protein RISW2_05445 [Roseivivax isoporae LMG 25204]